MTPGTVVAASRTTLLALLGLVFASGASALVYQILWMRLASLLFGVTVWATSVVLASYMAGLTLGSVVAGRWSDRLRRPLLVYAVVELGIGVSALATIGALDLVEQGYVALGRTLGEDLAVLSVARFVLAFATIVVPTSLMGATLPLMVRAVLRHGEPGAVRISLIYATNTAGAILGTLAAGLVLIGGIGVQATFLVAALLNFAVGVMAFIAARMLPVSSNAPAVETSKAAAPALPSRASRAILIASGLSGFATFALEVVWFRVLVLYLEATTYAFTGMLATVLLGIAVGSYAAAALARRGLASLTMLAALQLAVAATALLSFAAMGAAYGLPSGDLPLLRRLGEDFARTLVVSLLALMPATLLLGIGFPIGLDLWIGRGAKVGTRVGIFYGVNVAGAIAGSLLAGFVLLPALGARGALIAAAAVSLAAGLVLVLALSRRRGVALGLTGLAVFGALGVGVPDPFAAALAGRYPGEVVLWREEGLQSTVSVHRRPDGLRSLYLDGLPQANDHPHTVGVHRMIGTLPMVLHPEPREVLVVGLGGGATAGAASRHRASRLDIVELSPSVVRAARLFEDINERVLDAPNVTMRVDDARAYLMLTPKRYDVVMADIIIPYHAGAGHLYAQEFFQLARAALRDDGMMIQWIGEFPETAHKLIMRTFLSVFPDATLWSDGTLMIGTKRPLSVTGGALARTLERPGSREALAAVGITDLNSLRRLFTAGPDEMRRYVGEGLVLTDDRPLVEYFRSLPRGEPPRDLRGVRADPDRYIRP